MTERDKELIWVALMVPLFAVAFAVIAHIGLQIATSAIAEINYTPIYKDGF